MSNYILSCETTADMTKEQLKALDVPYVCAHYALDDKEYLDDIWEHITAHEFYQAMVDGAETRTFQINTAEFAEFFASFLKEGKDILHVSLSSGISGTYNSARMAAEELKEQFPERKIIVVDSLGASAGYGLLVDKMGRLKAEGMEMEALADWAVKNRLRVRHWFFSTDLTFYIKGGRISKTAGMMGSLLNICPLLDVDLNGKLVPRTKVRTKKKVIKEIVAKMIEQADDRADYAEKVFISNSDCEEDAKAVAALVKENFPKMMGDVAINSIGTSIGSHTGPGTVALFFWGDERDN